MSTQSSLFNNYVLHTPALLILTAHVTSPIFCLMALREIEICSNQQYPRNRFRIWSYLHKHDIELSPEIFIHSKPQLVYLRQGKHTGREPDVPWSPRHPSEQPSQEDRGESSQIHLPWAHAVGGTVYILSAHFPSMTMWLGTLRLPAMLWDQINANGLKKKKRKEVCWGSMHPHLLPSLDWHSFPADFLEQLNSPWVL